MDEVRAALAAEFPDRTVRSLTPIPRGNRKRTVVATFDDGSKVVVQSSGRQAAIRTEAAVARAVRERTSVPVPRVLATGTVGETGYVVVELATGRDLHEAFVDLPGADRRGVARTFGRFLAELHGAFRFDRYGEVVAADGRAAVDTDGGVPVGATAATEGFEATGTDDWREWFEGYLEAGLAALPDALSSVATQVGDAVDPAALPRRPPARLFPWDYRPGNALVVDGTVGAVLDWGEPLAAAPGLSLAKAEHLVADWYVEDAGERAALRSAFRSGYRAVRRVPETPRAYRLAAVVRSAVDSAGEVTRPGYPERTGDAAVAFHRERLREHLS